MKLKEHIEVRYDGDNKVYVFDFSQAKKIGKVTSRMFPILLGRSDWNGIGSGVLDRCGFLEFEKIDPYYTVRGAVGEYLVKKYIEESYAKKNLSIVLKSFTPASSGYDNFKKNERFGGVLDLAISSPEELRAVIEVKSKSMKDYLKIAENGNYPKEEVMQGEQLATLSLVDKLLMAYIFFNEVQEQNLRNSMATIDNVENFNVEELVKGLSWQPKDFTFHIKKIQVNREEVQKEMDKAYETLHRIIKLGSIHEMHFTNKEQEALDSHIKFKNGEPMEEDTPF